MQLSQLSIEQVLHLAQTARIDITAPEAQTLAEQLSDILAYVQRLGEVRTQGVEPVTQPVALTDVFRQDREQPHLAAAQALANAPAVEQDSFAVPRLIG